MIGKLRAKRFSVLGKEISALLVIAILGVGLGSAALLAVYGTITGTATASQSVLVDGKDISDMPITGEWDGATTAGNTIIGLHTLENRGGSPAAIGFSTACSNSSASENDQPDNYIDWSTRTASEACDGITTGYMKWDTPTNVLTGSRPTAIYNPYDRTGYQNYKKYEVWYKTSDSNLHYAYYHPDSSWHYTWDGTDTDVNAENDCPFVMKEGNTYYMVNYKDGGDLDGQQDFYIYTSSDGKTWTEKGKIFTNPDSSKWVKIDNPKLLKNSDGTYNMYFQAKLDTTDYPYYILLATTTETSLSDIADGDEDLEFTVANGGHSVLQPGASGAWDSLRVMQPMVIKSGNKYLMMYTGYDETDQHGKIGYAVSDDGVSWTKVDVSAQGYDTTFGTDAWKTSLVNANEDIELFYQNGANIDKATLKSLTSADMILQPGEVKGFFVENKFNVALMPDSYTLKMQVVPV